MPVPTNDTLFEGSHRGSPNPADANLFSLSDIAAAIGTDSLAVSVTTSKAVSTVNAAAPDSSSISLANSRASSAGSQATVADSKAVSGSLNTSTVDSKAASGSVNTSVADSKATSIATAVIIPVVSGVPGFQQPYSGASLRTANAKMAEIISVRDFGAVGNGVTSDRLAILATHTAALAAGGSVYLPAGTYVFDGAAQIFAAPFVFEPGAVLKVSAGSATYLPTIEAPPTQCFDASPLSDVTKGTILFTGEQPFYRPQWWGVVADGSTSDTLALQSAVDASAYNTARPGSPVLLPPGTIRFTTLKLGGSSGGGLGVPLIGASRYATVLETTTANATVIDANANGARIADLLLRSSSATIPLNTQVMIDSTSASGVSIERVDIDNYYVGIKASGVDVHDVNMGLLTGGAAGGIGVYLPDAVGTTFTRVVVNVRAAGHTGFQIEGLAGQPDTNIFIFCGTNRYPGVSGVSVKMTKSGGSAPRWTRFTNCAFETTENTTGINCFEYASGWNTTITSSYILGGNYGFLMAGAVEAYLDACRIIGTIIFGASYNGVYHVPSNTASYVDTSTPIVPALALTDCDIVENSQSSVGGFAGVSLGANSRGFSMRGGSVGRPQGNTAVVRRHSYGIEVAAGAADYDIDLSSINLRENVTAPSSGIVPTVASSGTIDPNVATFFVSGTSAISTITLPARARVLTILPTGVFTWTAAGNIALAGTAVVGKMLEMRYVQSTAKWYPSYT